MVEIPETLIQRLPGHHFIRVAKKAKEPVDKGWPTNPMNADDPKLQEWLRVGGNFGVVGGYGLVIVDIDLAELKWKAIENLPPTFTVESPGSKGWHLYYLCSLERPIRLRDRQGENVGDIQGLGKQVVGPNSQHPNGGIYRIVNEAPLAQVTRQQLMEAFKDYVIPDREVDIIEATAKQEKKEAQIDLDILRVVPLSGLHKRGTEYYGSHPVHGSDTNRNFWVNPSKGCWHCFRHGTGGGPLLWLAVEEGIIDCSEAKPGALKGEKFNKILEVARERGLIKDDDKSETAKKKKRKSQADRLVEYALSGEPIFFHDQHKTPYVRVRKNKVNINMPVHSREFRTWLASLMWHQEGKAPGTEALHSAMHVLEAKALFEGEGYVLYNRVAPAPDGIWIDMADEGWRALKVTAEGWRIVEDPPVLFKRYSHQKPLVEPKLGGDPWRLLSFINVHENNDADRLMLLATVVSYFIPRIPHVILVLYGIQGAGKTLAFVLIRRVVDPSSVETLTLPRNENERVQQLEHHWVCFYDNITDIPPWVSDTLCRAATGGGFTKRELYTDDQDIIYNFKRCVGLNGINIAAQKGDLLDRGLLIGLQDIPKEKRRTEKQILDMFEQSKAEILGGLLDTLVRAIQAYTSIKPKKLFRMADFTVWGCAIAKALGRSEEDFLNAYESKINLQIEEAAHASPVATVILDFMENRNDWEGTPSDLYRQLLGHAKIVGISTRQKAWPKAPHVLVRYLNELTPALKALGLEVETGIHTGQERKLRISNTRSVKSVTSVSKESDGSNATNTASDISSRLFQLAEVVSCGRMILASIGKCAYCGKKPERLTHSVKTFVAHHQVCEECAEEINEYLKRRSRGDP